MANSDYITFPEFLASLDASNTEAWSSGRVYTHMLIIADHNRRVSSNVTDEEASVFENAGRGGLAALIANELESSTWALEEQHNAPHLHPHRAKFADASFQLAGRWAEMLKTAPKRNQHQRDALINHTPSFLGTALTIFVGSVIDTQWMGKDKDCFNPVGVDDLDVARAIKSVASEKLTFGAIPSPLPQFPSSINLKSEQAA